MQIFLDHTGLQHIGKASTGRTLCHKELTGFVSGVALDVHRVDPLDTPGVAATFCTSCHVTFHKIMARHNVRDFFIQDDIVRIHNPEIGENMIVNYRGPQVIGLRARITESEPSPYIYAAVVYNPKSGAQFQVPYSYLYFVPTLFEKHLLF